MNVLMSIRPEFVEKIVSGEKKYEFRRKIFKKDVKNVLIYSTAPDKMIVGYFELEQVLEDTPQRLWDSCQDFAGITEKDYFEYFSGSSTGFALQIGRLTLFKYPIQVTKILEGFRPPQSFQYVDEELFGRLCFIGSL